MPRARPCGRARLRSAPTTLRARDPNSAPATLRARATQARGTPVDGAVHGAWCPRQDRSMRRSSSRARIRATQCESERSTTGAISEEPLPAAIQDAVTAAIEDGVTMDEIVAWVRAHDDEGSDLIPRARSCPRTWCSWSAGWSSALSGRVWLRDQPLTGENTDDRRHDEPAHVRGEDPGRGPTA